MSVNRDRRFGLVRVEIGRALLTEKRIQQSTSSRRRRRRTCVETVRAVCDGGDGRRRIASLPWLLVRNEETTDHKKADPDATRLSRDDGQPTY